MYGEHSLPDVKLPSPDRLWGVDPEEAEHTTVQGLFLQ